MAALAVALAGLPPSRAAAGVVEPWPEVVTRLDDDAPGPPRIELLQAKEREVQIVARGLPAVSEDGKRVAIAVIGEDGMRGNPNLAIQIRDVGSDALLARFAILDATELFVPSIGERIGRVNATLDRTSWTRLSPATSAERASCWKDMPDAVPVGALRVALKGTRLSVGAEKRPLLIRQVSSWMAPTRRHHSGIQCKHMPYLASARTSADARVLLVRVGYCGADSYECWDPDSTWHVVRLPKR